MHFTGQISVEKMKRAIGRLVERHDALRSSFDETGRIIKVNPSLTVPVPVSDVTAGHSSSNGTAVQDNTLRS